jgi:hypothetical protein
MPDAMQMQCNRPMQKRTEENRTLTENLLLPSRENLRLVTRAKDDDCPSGEIDRPPPWTRRRWECIAECDHCDGDGLTPQGWLCNH